MYETIRNIKLNGRFLVIAGILIAVMFSTIRLTSAIPIPNLEKLSEMAMQDVAVNVEEPATPTEGHHGLAKKPKYAANKKGLKSVVPIPNLKKKSEIKVDDATQTVEQPATTTEGHKKIAKKPQNPRDKKLAKKPQNPRDKKGDFEEHTTEEDDNEPEEKPDTAILIIEAVKKEPEEKPDNAILIIEAVKKEPDSKEQKPEKKPKPVFPDYPVDEIESADTEIVSLEEEDGMRNMNYAEYETEYAEDETLFLDEDSRYEKEETRYEDEPDYAEEMNEYPRKWKRHALEEVHMPIEENTVHTEEPPPFAVKASEPIEEHFAPTERSVRINKFVIRYIGKSN